jgi:hypothetical protein
MPISATPYRELRFATVNGRRMAYIDDPRGGKGRHLMGRYDGKKVVITGGTSRMG